jgi:hypothetical protein
VRGRLGIGALLVPSLAAAAAGPACLAVASHPDGAPLARVEAERGAFTISYVHSVTRTPVEERFRTDGPAIVETEMRFRRHGPGLPTEADAGGSWRREGDVYVVTMERRFDAIPIRVHADQQWRMSVEGDPRPVNLAQWGNRAIALSARPGPCLTGPTGYGAR